MASITPPPAKQGQSWRCWAACMESWSYISWYWDNTNQETFAEKYGDHNGALNTSDWDLFGKYLRDYSLDFDIYEAGTLTPANATRYLERWGYFMFVQRVGATLSHSRLAFDVTEQGELRAMEPMVGFPNYIRGDPTKLSKVMVIYRAG